MVGCRGVGVAANRAGNALAGEVSRRLPLAAGRGEQVLGQVADRVVVSELAPGASDRGARAWSCAGWTEPEGGHRELLGPRPGAGHMRDNGSGLKAVHWLDEECHEIMTPAP